MGEVGLSEAYVRSLSQQQRDLVVAHVDGSVDWGDPARTHLVSVRNSLMSCGLLLGQGGLKRRPKVTRLSQAGRSALGLILGWYADSLVRAGLGDTPMQVLARMKAGGAFAGDGGEKSSGEVHFLVDR